MSDSVSQNHPKISEGVLIGLKAALIGVLVLVFCIPVELIKGIVNDRQETKQTAQREIVENSGGADILGANYLTIPVWYSEESLNSKGALTKDRIKRTMIVMPSELSIKANTKATLRTYGIFAVPVYTADAVIDLSFEFTPEDSGLLEPSPVWEDAQLVVEIQDPRAIAEAPLLAVSGVKTPMRAATPALGFLKRAVQAPVRLTAADSEGSRRGLKASVSVRLSGAESIRFLPSGESSRVALSGDWKSPHFSGRLPIDPPVVETSGFTAAWFADDSSRPFPRVFAAGEDYAEDSSEALFGMAFEVPADAYLQAHRALRYAILFIFIPFAALFLFEVILKKRIHPLQYILIGLADSLFYLLLLSLSEHLPFMAAYLASALAVTAVLTLYIAAALKDAKRTFFIIPALLIAQYTYLYCALVSEEYALLIGSIGLFVIVAATMIGTRKIDWYSPRGAKAAKKAGAQESLIE